MDWVHSPTTTVTWPEWQKLRLRWFERDPLAGLFAHNHPIRIDRVKQLVSVLRSRPYDVSRILEFSWYCSENGFDVPQPGAIIDLDWFLDLRGLTICPACIPDLGDLRDLYFGDCRLDGAEFVECDLRGVEFSESSMKACLFDECNLQTAHMFGTDFEGSYFLACDLRGASFADAHLSLVEFNFCRIAAADFSGATFTRLQTKGRTLPDDVAVISPIAFEYRASARFLDCEHEPTVGDRLLVARDLRSVKPLLFRPLANFTKAVLEGVDWSRARRLQRYILGEQYLRELRVSAKGHPLRRLGLFLWWLTSDYGRSIARWLLMSGLICAAFGLVWGIVDSTAQVPKALMWGRPLCRAGSNVPMTSFTPFYFSIVAYTTLGFGDVVPANGSGQVLLAAEVICGYIALGVLLSIIARRVIAE
ncbi:MAG: pentapeptide repeat-containing protein [bacterium]